MRAAMLAVVVAGCARAGAGASGSASASASADAQAHADAHAHADVQADADADAIDGIVEGAIGRGEAKGAYRYSELGYILLGEIVARASGEKLDAFVKRRIFDPLAMTSTAFVPSAELAARSAPTEARDGVMLAGRVHDPRAALLGG